MAQRRKVHLTSIYHEFWAVRTSQSPGAREIFERLVRVEFQHMQGTFLFKVCDSRNCLCDETRPKKTYSSEGMSGTLDLYTAMRLDQWLLCITCIRNPWSTSTAKPALAHAWSSFSPPNLLRMLQRPTEVILAVVPVVHICFAGTTRHGHLEALGWESDTPIRSNATHEHHLLFGHPMPKWAPAHSTAHAPTS